MIAIRGVQYLLMLLPAFDNVYISVFGAYMDIVLSQFQLVLSAVVVMMMTVTTLLS